MDQQSRIPRLPKVPPTRVASPRSTSQWGQALRTQAFWILAIFSGAGMMVQAGVSLHQVSHYISQGVDPRFAAMSASIFALAQMPASLFWAALARRMPIRFLMMFAAFVVALAAAGTVMSDWLLPEIISAAGVGFGVGGLHLLIRLVWADYYGRQNLGTIRGLTMSVQVGGQALGAGNRRVHVRLFRQLPDPVYVFRRGRVLGGDHGAGGQTATGSDPGACEGTGQVFRVKPARKRQYREVDHAPGCRAAVPVETPTTRASFSTEPPVTKPRPRFVPHWGWILPSRG